MSLDLDDGILKMESDSGKILLSAAEKTYPLQIGTESSKNFQVSWSGKLRARGANIKGTIYADEGELGDLTVTGVLDCTDGTISGGIIDGAQIYFGTGQYYLYESDSGATLKTVEKKEEGITRNGIFYKYVGPIDANRAG